MNETICSHWWQIKDLWWAVVAVLITSWVIIHKATGCGIPYWIARGCDWIEAAVRATGNAAPALAKRWVRQLAIEQRIVREGIRDATNLEARAPGIQQPGA